MNFNRKFNKHVDTHNCTQFPFWYFEISELLFFKNVIQLLVCFIKMPFYKIFPVLCLLITESHFRLPFIYF